MVGVIRSGVGDVIQNLLSIESISFRRSKDTDRTKGAFGINVQAFAFTSSHADWELASNSKGMA
jgi:hypothetical protein